MILEFLGHKLSACSTLQYLDNGFVFYGSMFGDSYIL